MTLSDSPQTWYWDVEKGSPVGVECLERPAPILVERRASVLGRGDFFGATFVGSLAGDPAPADDVEALVWVPRALWPERETTVASLVSAGARVVGTADPSELVRVHPDESFRVALSLL